MKIRFGSLKRAWPVPLLAAVLLLPAVTQNNYILRVAINVFVYITLASSLNVINGYSGQFNLGQAAFYGIGAYTAGILATRYGLSFWLLLPVSGLMASLFGGLLAIPTMRLTGKYLAITTLGFSEIIRLTILNWTSLTRGPMGIPGIPLPRIFGHAIRSDAGFYYIIVGIAALMIFATYRVINSRVGRAWIAIREDEAAARAMGVETATYKLLNFMYGAFWAGVAGCFYAFLTSYISADSFTLDEGFSILAMVLVGGQGSLVGPVVGASFLTILTELFRSAAQYRLVVFGLAILVTMHLRPQGIAGDRMLSGRYNVGKGKALRGSGAALAREVAG